MKPLPWIASLAFLCLSIQATAARGYIEEFYDAKAIEKSDPAAAHAAYLRSFHLAVAAENADYATSAGLNACFLLHNRGKAVEAGSLAREVLDAIHPLPTKMVRNDIIRRCELFGFLESGLLMEGRIGQAWKANRATAETLRGRQIPADAEGEPLTLQEARRLPSELRSFGWRILDQEAGFLDISGRSVEALRLLDEAAASINATWQNSTPNTRYYAYRLLASRSRLIDFLGDPQLAIQGQEALL